MERVGVPVGVDGLLTSFLAVESGGLSCVTPGGCLRARLGLLLGEERDVLPGVVSSLLLLLRRRFALLVLLLMRLSRGAGKAGSIRRET